MSRNSSRDGVWATVLIALTATSMATAALASYAPTAGGDDGGGFPVPFDALNRKVELADGEVYFLVGRVVFVDAQPFLYVDLGLHSWLANRKRAENPAYPLEPTGLTEWADFEGLLVSLRVQANGRIVQRHDGPMAYEIALQALNRPELHRPEPQSKPRGGGPSCDQSGGHLAEQIRPRD